MKIVEAKLESATLETLLALSAAWEAEESCYGYHQNTRADIEGKRIFLATEGARTVGYLLGQACRAERMRSIMADDTPYFEVEELYVAPDRRSTGVGGALFRYAREKSREEGLQYLMLSTATKDYRRILHFYIDELGMDFWSARLFQKL